MNVITPYNLNDHLTVSGYNIVSLEEVFTNGATECRYFRLTLGDDTHRFIKVGEKVNYEINNLDYLRRVNFSESPKMLAGTSTESGILVLNWATSPRLGYDLVYSLHNGTTPTRNFIRMQESAFNFLKKLYSLEPGNKKLPYPQSARERISQSLILLRNAEESIIVDTQRINLNEVIDTPISIVSKRGDSSPISIREMCLNLDRLITTSDEMPFKKIIHADFHPPNIIGDSDRITRVIDFSDMSYADNPCWDLGKWLNYLKRFHRIAHIRSLGQADEYVVFRNNRTFLTFENTNPVSVELSLIEENAIETFQNITGLSKVDIVTNELLCEFIVNVYTLHRHSRLYPYTMKNVLLCIRESYQAVIDSM